MNAREDYRDLASIDERKSRHMADHPNTKHSRIDVCNLNRWAS